jgi:hypothetical protein
MGQDSRSGQLVLIRLSRIMGQDSQSGQLVLSMFPEGIKVDWTFIPLGFAIFPDLYSQVCTMYGIKV